MRYSSRLDAVGDVGHAVGQDLEIAKAEVIVAGIGLVEDVDSVAGSKVAEADDRIIDVVAVSEQDAAAGDALDNVQRRTEVEVIHADDNPDRLVRHLEGDAFAHIAQVGVGNRVAAGSADLDITDDLLLCKRKLAAEDGNRGVEGNIVKADVRGDIAVNSSAGGRDGSHSDHAVERIVVHVIDADSQTLFRAGDVEGHIDVAVGHGEDEHADRAGSIGQCRQAVGVNPLLGRDDAVRVIGPGSNGDIAGLDVVLTVVRVGNDGNLVARDSLVDVLEVRTVHVRASAELVAVLGRGIDDQEFHAALGYIIQGRKVVNADLLGSEDCGNGHILRAILDHLEVVEVVELVGSVLLVVNTEGDHVILGPAGLGHSDRDIVAVCDVKLGHEVEPADTGGIVDHTGDPVDGDLPQTQTGQIVASLIHALHRDGEGLGIKDGTDIHAGGGHLKGKREGVGIKRGHRDGRNLDGCAVVLAGDKELGVILGGVELVAVAGGDDDHDRITGLAGVGGSPIPGGREVGNLGVDLVADGADAFNDGGADGSLAGLKVGFDVDALTRHLEVTVAVGFVGLFLEEIGAVGDSVLDEGNTLGAVVAQVNVLTLGDLALDGLELGDLLLGLRELGGLAVPGNGDAAVGIGIVGDLSTVHVDSGPDIGSSFAGDDRGYGNAALGHGEALVGLVVGDLQAVAVADDIIVDVVTGGELRGSSARIIDELEVDLGTGISLGDRVFFQLCIRADVRRTACKSVDIAELRGHDENVVALGPEGDLDVHIKAGHREGVAENIHARCGIVVLGYLELDGLIALVGLGHDGDLGALGGTGHGAAVDLEVEAAADRIVDIEGVGRDRFENDFHIHIRVRHDKGLGAADRKLFLRGGRDKLPVGRIDRGDLIVGIDALDDDRCALDSRLDGHAADRGAGLAAVVGADVDVMAGLDDCVHTGVAARHDEGIARKLQIGLAVRMLDRQALDGLAGVGVGHDGDLRAGRSRGNGLVVDVEEHCAVGGGHAAGKLVELGRGGRARGGGAVAVGDGGGGRRGGGGTGVAGAGHGHRQRHGIEELVAGLDRREVLGLVEDLQQTLVGAVVDALGSGDAVGRVMRGDDVLHDAVAGGADGRGNRGRDDEGVPCSDLGPVGDVVHLLDERGKDCKVYAQRIAHAGDSLAVGHGVGHQVVGKRVSGGSGSGGARGDRSRGAGGGSAGHVAGGGGRHGSTGVIDGGAGAVGDQQRVIIAGRQSQCSADGQLIPLAVLNAVEDHDRGLARVVVQAQALADPQNKVALRHRILDGVGAIVGGCVRIDRQPRKQGHDHQYCKQHTNDPFLHSCSP